MCVYRTAPQESQLTLISQLPARAQLARQGNPSTTTLRRKEWTATSPTCDEPTADAELDCFDMRNPRIMACSESVWAGPRRTRRRCRYCCKPVNSTHSTWTSTNTCPTRRKWTRLCRLGESSRDADRTAGQQTQLTDSNFHEKCVGATVLILCTCVASAATNTYTVQLNHTCVVRSCAGFALSVREGRLYFRSSVAPSYCRCLSLRATTTTFEKTTDVLIPRSCSEVASGPQASAGGVQDV